MLEQDIERAGAGGGFGDAMVDPAGGGGQAEVFAGGVRARGTDAGRGQGVGLPAGEQGLEAGGESIEAVPEQDPGFAGDFGGLVGVFDRAVGLGADPGGLDAVLPGREGGDGMAQAGQEGDQAGGEIAHWGQYTAIRAMMQEYLEKFPPYFFRVHRSFAINIKQLIEIQTETLKVGEFTLPLAKSYREELLSKLNLG